MPAHAFADTMDNLDDVIASKLDAPLMAIWVADHLESSARIPVVIRSDPGHVSELASRLTTLGATVRHQISAFGTVAAWVPIGWVVAVGRDPRVRAIELEQEFRINAVSASHGIGDGRSRASAAVPTIPPTNKGDSDDD
jgi:hypothetical protein